LQATSLNGEESEHHGAAIPDDGQEHSHSESHENVADTSQASEHGDSLNGDTDTSQASEHGDSLDGDTDTSQASEHGDSQDSETDASQSPDPDDSQDSGADASQTTEHGDTADSNTDASQGQSDASSGEPNDEQADQTQNETNTGSNNEPAQSHGDSADDSHADDASNADHSLLIDDNNLLIQQGDSGSVQQASDTRSEASLSNLLGDEHDDTHAAGEESAADSQTDAGQETGVTLSDAAPINFADVISDDEDGNDLSALIKVTGEDSASEPDHVPAESGALDGEGGDSGYDGGHDDHLDNLIAKPDPHA
jgi:hypothetical protein